MTEQKNELQTISKENSLDFFGSAEDFELGQRMAKLFAASTLVPKAFQGNVGNCLIAMNMAKRMKADTLMVMQSLSIIHGKPGFEAKFLIACFNVNGKFSPIRYEFVGEEGKDNWGCTAYAFEKETGDLLRGTTVTIEMAKKEGWFGKEGSKWKTMPQLMLQYRAATFFIRTVAPEISLGFQTKEEVEDAIVIDSANAEEAQIVNDKELQDVTVLEKEIQENANQDTLGMNADTENEVKETPTMQEVFK